MTDPSRRSFTLGALFVLVSFCGVMAAIVAPLARAVAAGTVSIEQVAIAMFAGAVIVGLLGAAVGAHHYNWVVGGAVGLGLGAAIGAACGPLALIPAKAFPGLLVAAVGGSIVMIAIGALLRWTSEP